MLCQCLQLKEDTIALAAGAVTAMLAANAAAAGPMDSPEKVCSVHLTSSGAQPHVCLTQSVVFPPQARCFVSARERFTETPVETASLSWRCTH